MSVSDMDLKRHLEDLNREISEILILQQLDDKMKILTNLKTLVEEATRTTPRKRWYLLASQALIESLQLVGEKAKSAGESLKSVIISLEEDLK